MPDTDILKQKSLNTGQIMALVFFAVSATFAVTKIVLDIEHNKERIEQVDRRVDKKFKQAVDKIEAVSE